MVTAFLPFPPVWSPSAADTDPQTFCKRFQLYLGDLDYVSAVELVDAFSMRIDYQAWPRPSPILCVHELYTYPFCVYMYMTHWVTV